MKYWRLEPYVGFGADAHSFDDGQRSQNVESAAEYVDSIRAGRSPRLASTPANATEERFFVGLRLIEGIRPHPDEWRKFDAPIQRFLADGLLAQDGDQLRLTDRGVLLSNEVFAGIRDLMIDLRSDTVTQPTPAMRRAMAEAEVGDDVYGEDPTVNRLEQRAAEIMGKEAGLFVAHRHHGQHHRCQGAHAARPGSDLRSARAPARLGTLDDGLVLRLPGSPGPRRQRHPALGRVRTAIRPGGPHSAPTALIEIENTHNMAGGTVYPMDVLADVCGHAHDAGLRVHLDGARIFNAACHLNKPVREIAAHADTVMFCLSKALGAPAGSMLVGTQEAIARGRLYRKRLGGGMRQVGVLAAAGLIALEEMPHRLGEDHANARFLAERSR